MRSNGDVLSMVSEMLTLMEAANTETRATRVTPIIRADAVEAVRRGARTVFSRASLPVIDRNGDETTLATGPAINGARVEMPKNTTAAPPPTRASDAPF